MSRITDFDPMEPEQVNINVDVLHIGDVSDETTVDKRITVAKLHATAPAATATSKGAVSSGAQTFGGVKTFADGISVTGDLTVEGDIYQNGSAYDTHAEKLYTKKDMIITRDGAQSALATGALSGIKAEHYDANGNNGVLGFDNSGTARVGDEGDTQPLLTRSEEADLTNGNLLVWDGTNRKAVDGGALGTAIDNKIAALDVASVGGSGKYISAISETDGKISATESALDTVVTTGSAAPVTSGAVASAIAPLVAAANELDHNVPRWIDGALGKDITSYYSDGTLWKRLNGTDGFTLFEDIYVGDYFQMSRAITAPDQDSSYAVTGSQCVTIAGINTLRGNGDTIDMEYNHLVMVPGKGETGAFHFGRKRMNSSHTTSGGYVSSEMHGSTLGAVVSAGSTASGATINQQLYAEFGSHLKTTRELLTSSVNGSLVNRIGSASGAADNWGWYSCQACLMSEVEVYGSIVFSSSGYDTGTACKQLPLFAFSKKAINNRSSYYWLKDVASAAGFCYVSGGGFAAYLDAGYTGGYVRPRFVIGA